MMLAVHEVRTHTKKYQDVKHLILRFLDKKFASCIRTQNSDAQLKNFLGIFFFSGDFR